MNKIRLLLPILAGIMFGSSGVFVRELTEFGMNNPTVLFSRVVFATFEMLIVILIYNRDLLKIKIKDLPIFIGTGIIAMLGLNLCYNEAVNRLTLSLAAVLLSTAPVFVIILAAIFFKEKITKTKVGSMIMVIIGCVLVSGLLEQKADMQISMLGVILGIAAAVFFALYSIFSKIATDKGYHTYTVIFYSVFFITIVLLPFAGLEIIGDFLREAPVTKAVFLVFHSLFASVLPYVFLTLALLYAEAGKVSIVVSGGEPIAAVFFGIIFYSEIPSVLMVLGLGIVITALTILCRKPKETIG